MIVDDDALDGMIDEVEREITMRARLYPRWVRAGSMGAAQAKTQMARMQAVLATLKAVKGGFLGE